MTCQTCTRPANNPFHVVGKDGKTIHGCVDSCHGATLVISEYAFWYNRKEAKAIRRANAKGRAGKGF